MGGKRVVVVIGLSYLAMAVAAYGAAARELATKRNARMAGPGNGEEEVDCWGSLVQLKSCSNEIMRYFMNGEADIGPDCCRAITVITQNCWPAILSSIGFTHHQAYILRGYCDAAPALAPSPSPSPSPH